ncbi:hypothetical protein J5N97_003053 [Dioscorea zingiberensis]|uniref:Uncharacterized protein n=1 Tax=Dioscorea zingiberensis TaxID=325984 RepID=A0A9D5D599_9LILI|nr:hypothetical protein J5N97_003053 [Dioscorea zingiberensis]
MAIAGEEERAPKLRVFFMPFFAGGHIIPMTDLACIFAKRPCVGPTMVTTPANATLILPTLDRSASFGHPVQLLLYSFPSAATNLPSGIENLASVSSDESWKIYKAVDLSRDAHERIIREHTPDAIISDIPFWWTTAIAKDLGISRKTFHAVEVFPQCIMNNLVKNRVHDHVPTDSHPFTIPDLPGPCINMVKSELPEFLKQRDHLTSAWDDLKKSQLESYGVVVNTFYELEHEYCDLFREFMNERLVVEVHEAGVRVWDGFRSSSEKEKVVVPSEAIERAVRKFMEGGEGEEMRKRAAEWAEIAGAAVAEGGSSHRDLNSLIDELFALQHERKNGKHIE